jgi:uncharacterized RDD family membrane protein YckC
MSQTTGTADLRARGADALRRGQADEAIQALTQHLRATPTDGDGFGMLGIAYSQKGQHAQAIQCLDRAVQLRPDAAPLHFNRGLALERAGRTADAAGAFGQTLRLDPKHPHAAARLQALGQSAPSAAPTAPPSSPAPPGSGSTDLSSLWASPAGAAPSGPASMPAAVPSAHPAVPSAHPAVPPAYGAAPVYGAPPAAPGFSAPPAPPAYGAPPTAPGFGAPPPAPGMPGAAPPAFASAPPAVEMPATIACPRCGKETEHAMLCQWCSAPLPPKPRPAPAVSAPPPGAGYMPTAGMPGPAYYSGGGNVMDQYSTGEAFMRRAVAWCLDYGLIIGLAIFLVIMQSVIQAPAMRTVVFVILMGASIGQWLMLGMKGQTIGKMLLGLKVVGPDGDVPGCWKAYRRMRMMGLSLLVVGLGYLWMLWDADQQTWHDKWADTYVVKA